MAVPIRNERHFRRAIAQRPGRDLYAFLLFDSRPDHQPVQEFAIREFRWLDELAGSARMFLFLYIPNQSAGEQRNPSLNVARDFNILPNQLPGIVLFGRYGKQEGSAADVIGTDGIYFPLKLELFDSEAGGIRDVIADLFSVIHECRKSSRNAEELMNRLRSEVAAMTRERRLRPLVMWLRGGVIEIARLPKVVLESAATAFGTGLGMAASGKISGS
jgi:hypothetical protein